MMFFDEVLGWFYLCRAKKTATLSAAGEIVQSQVRLLRLVFMI